MIIKHPENPTRSDLFINATTEEVMQAVKQYAEEYLHSPEGHFVNWGELAQDIELWVWHILDAQRTV